MNDADNTPSPSRFCKMLGIRKPGLERIGRAGVAEIVREDALANHARDARQQDARGDQPRASSGDRLGRSPGGILIDDGIVSGDGIGRNRASGFQR
jgi:hypothetical protein